MKKLAVAVLAVTMLMMMLAVPVMATPRDSSPAWHTYPATDTYEEITYGELTDMCLAAGLSENPYPEPIPLTSDFLFPFYYENASVYFELTLTIGDEAYPSIACNTYVMTFNVLTGDGILDYQGTHYLGALGKLNQGFAGVATANLYGYGTSQGYFLGDWDMQGFGRFTGQTLILSQDSRTSAIATGYCLVLGNKWYK